ncbi:hypothetical protein SPBRAN_1964 [uncultured Candidatus Thioglobus sp.]|nr:hypothetical protein SPBRAN_1964 [uncultured Candidatus Thioglobus sp.]
MNNHQNAILNKKNIPASMCYARGAPIWKLFKNTLSLLAVDLKNYQANKICHPDNCLPIYAKVSEKRSN